MKDFLGNELNVGDDVVIMQKSYRNFIKGKIIRITTCTVIVQHAKTNVGDTETKQTGDQVIKIV